MMAHQKAETIQMAVDSVDQKGLQMNLDSY